MPPHGTASLTLALVFLGITGCAPRTIWHSDSHPCAWAQDADYCHSREYLTSIHVFEASHPGLNASMAKPGMDKESIVGILGQPAKVIKLEPPKRYEPSFSGKAYEADEIWWYLYEKGSRLDFAFPLGWPWLLFHPDALIDPDLRDEFYWHNGVLVDIKRIRGYYVALP